MAAPRGSGAAALSHLVPFEISARGGGFRYWPSVGLKERAEITG